MNPTRKTIFLTGGTGFIGAHFLNTALRAGHEVFALRRPGSKPRLPLVAEPQWIEGDLTDDFSSQLANCQALVHMAAAGVNRPVASQWNDYFQTNVLDSLSLWQSALAAGVSRLVICGSCFEYGKSGERYDFIPVSAPLEPTAAYHASKAAATQAALGLSHDKNAEVLVLRPFHVFGEGEEPQRFWPALRTAALEGSDFPMSPGEQIRDFVPADFVAAAFLDALSRQDLLPGLPLVENVGTGNPVSLANFARHWWEKWGATGHLRIGALPYRPNEVMRYAPDLGKTS